MFLLNSRPNKYKISTESTPTFDPETTTMDHAQIEQQAKEAVMKLFSQSDKHDLYYHNLAHTERVVMRAMEIAAQYELSPIDKTLLYVAAWFHDTGHLFAAMQEHEAESIRIAHSFLRSQNISPAYDSIVAGCILSTQYPTRPTTLLEQILCDADTYHFGTPEFKTTDELIKKELEVTMHKTFDHWYHKTLQLLESHHFYTSYCQQKLEDGKQQIIDYIKTLASQEA